MIAGTVYRIALKLRTAGAADKTDGFPWAFRQRRRQRADSFKRWLGGAPCLEFLVGITSAVAVDD